MNKVIDDLCLSIILLNTVGLFASVPGLYTSLRLSPKFKNTSSYLTFYGLHDIGISLESLVAIFCAKAAYSVHPSPLAICTIALNHTIIFQDQVLDNRSSRCFLIIKQQYNVNVRHVILLMFLYI